MTEPVAFRRVYGLESYSRGQRGIEPPPAVCQRHKSAAIPPEDDWRTFDFPSRMLRRRVSQEDVDAFTAKCDVLQPNKSSVFHAPLENSWTVTLRADKRVGQIPFDPAMSPKAQLQRSYLELGSHPSPSLHPCF